MSQVSPIVTFVGVLSGKSMIPAVETVTAVLLSARYHTTTHNPVSHYHTTTHSSVHATILPIACDSSQSHVTFELNYAY